MLRQVITQTQTQTLRQEQILAPQQIQSLEMLQATIPELEQKLNEILAANPALELVNPGREELAGNPIEGETAIPVDRDGAEAPEDARETPLSGGSTMPEMASDSGDSGEDPGPFEHGLETPDDALAAYEKLEESWEDFLPSASTGHSQSSAEEEEKRQYRFDSLTASATLQEILLEQLRQLDGMDETQLRLGEEIIGSIDDGGYLRSHPADIAIACSADLEEVKKLLARIQQFDPPGVGARDLRESLLLQLTRQGKKDSLAYKVVAHHLAEIGRNQIPQVAKALRVPPGRLYEALAEIRQLAPYPGTPATSSSEPVMFVLPEVTVSRDLAGAWQVDSHREYRPRLRLSRRYLELLHDPDTPAEARQYIRQKIAESKLLIHALDNRQSTIEKITWCLIRLQEAFFENGRQHLRPLILQQVAQELGLHETTIGRAIANKYLQTPHGLVPFKFFFSSGLENAAGSMVSSQSIKQKLQDLIHRESPAHPLSDQELVALLREQGMQLARRTVAKYREELNVPPSHLRRKFSTMHQAL